MTIFSEYYVLTIPEKTDDTLPYLYANCIVRLRHLLYRSQLHFQGFGASEYQKLDSDLLLSTIHPNVLIMVHGSRDREASMIIHNGTKEVYTNACGVSKINVASTIAMPGQPTFDFFNFKFSFRYASRPVVSRLIEHLPLLLLRR